MSNVTSVPYSVKAESLQVVVAPLYHSPTLTHKRGKAAFAGSIYFVPLPIPVRVVPTPPHSV